MNILVGTNVIESKKNGKKYTILHMVDGEVKDTATSKGQFVCTEMIENGAVEIQGELKINNHVRVFKESVNGMDKVTLVVCSERKGK